MSQMRFYSRKQFFHSHVITHASARPDAGTVEHAHAGQRTFRISSEGIVFRQPPDKAGLPALQRNVRIPDGVQATSDA